MTPSANRIQPIELNDLYDYKKVILDLLYENYSVNFPDRSELEKYALKSYKDMVKFCEDKSAIIFGAYEDGTIVGFLWAYSREFLGENRIHLGHIVVNSIYRGKGIGTLMIDSLEKYAIQKKIYIIELMTTISNQNTMDFYKSKGFTTTRVQFEKKLGD